MGMIKLLSGEGRGLVDEAMRAGIGAGPRPWWLRAPLCSSLQSEPATQESSC